MSVIPNRTILGFLSGWAYLTVGLISRDYCSSRSLLFPLANRQNTMNVWWGGK